jgi:hypothetical protein
MSTFIYRNSSSGNIEPKSSVLLPEEYNDTVSTRLPRFFSCTVNGKLAPLPKTHWKDKKDFIKISKNPQFEKNRFNIDNKLFFEILEGNVCWCANVAYPTYIFL